MFQERAFGDDLLRRPHALHSGGGGQGDHVSRRGEAVHGVQRVGDERRPAHQLRPPGLRHLPAEGARLVGRQRQAEVRREAGGLPVAVELHAGVRGADRPDLRRPPPRQLPQHARPRSRVHAGRGAGGAAGAVRDRRALHQLGGLRQRLHQPARHQLADQGGAGRVGLARAGPPRASLRRRPRRLLQAAGAEAARPQHGARHLL